MSAILEYQKAVYAKLVADSNITAAVVGVYDIVPQGAIAPYIYFGDVVCEEIGNLAGDMCRISFPIICVTESSGKKEAAEIANLVRKSLHLSELDVTGFEHINTRLTEEEIELSSNGTTYLAVLDFEAVIVA